MSTTDDYKDLSDEAFVVRIPGQTLSRAKELLKLRGILVENIYVTAPPRYSTGDFKDNSRVIKVIKIRDNMVDLLVCNPSL